METKNPNVKVRRAATRQVVERFMEATPEAFTGDALCLLQVVYRDPAIPLNVQMDAAGKAIRFERPTLMATVFKDLTTLPAGREQRIRELLERTQATIVNAEDEGDGD